MDFDEEAAVAVLMREAIGGSLRRARTARRRTLREVSRRARVSLGYLSEVERGRKEPSSELLAAICEALDIALHDLLSEAAGSLAAAAEAARPRRPIGLRHLDLRLASGHDAVATSPPAALAQPVMPQPAPPQPLIPQPAMAGPVRPGSAATVPLVSQPVVSQPEVVRPGVAQGEDIEAEGGPPEFVGAGESLSVVSAPVRARTVGEIRAAA